MRERVVIDSAAPAVPGGSAGASGGVVSTAPGGSTPY